MWTQGLTLWECPTAFFLLEHDVGFVMLGFRPHMNADNMLARVFGAFEALVAQFHASLVLTARTIRAVTLDTSGVLRQFGLYFDVTMDDRHNNPRGSMRHAGFQESRDYFAETKELSWTGQAGFG
jgi:hypothetical protein